MATFQHQFGQAAIDSVVSFSRADIKTAQQYAADEFSHIGSAPLRRAVSKTMYGARWLYKLGLGLLVDGDESIAHVRTQVIDYGSICEALLSDAILHGITRNVMAGTAYQTANCLATGQAINWNAGVKADKIAKRTFKWFIEVAADETMVTPHVKGLLTQLRNLRNTVHITELATSNQNYYRTIAKASYNTVFETITATKAYKQAHP